MKIVHICLRTFTDEMSYQENLLAKYHRKSGLEVTIIASTWRRDPSGIIVEADQRDYINQDDIHIVRLPIKGRNDVSRKFRKFKGLYETLCNEKPDILFLHNCQYVDIAVITKYIREYGTGRVYVDNHGDFSNSATNWVSKEILHKIIWKCYVHMLEPYVTKFYGVLPARVDFLTEMYKLPKEKCELLVMGADDELAIEAKECRKHTREKYGVVSDDFLIVTGGKINKYRPQVVFLEEAVKKMHNSKIKLCIFGSVDDELKNDVMGLCDEQIVYVGWLSREETYQLIAAADLAVYPGGRHSVLWEQTVGQAVPVIAKHWEGMHHIDLGGNAEFLYEDSCEEIQKKLEELIHNPYKYQVMKQAAQNCAEEFRYGKIARKSIQQE